MMLGGLTLLTTVVWSFLKVCFNTSFLSVQLNNSDCVGCDKPLIDID